jgi:hypothetical protein
VWTRVQVVPRVRVANYVREGVLEPGSDIPVFTAWRKGYGLGRQQHVRSRIAPHAPPPPP